MRSRVSEGEGIRGEIGSGNASIVDGCVEVVGSESEDEGGG